MMIILKEDEEDEYVTEKEMVKCIVTWEREREREGVGRCGGKLIKKLFTYCMEVELFTEIVHIVTYTLVIGG